ncbi:MAG: pre-peptidase C-terminal domain-containing protein [Caldilinea sp.]|nr:pre-peptidase C-terminal domain-containing protein [Caldilinea sp.]
MLNEVPVVTAGTYTIRVTALTGIGTFTLSSLLNAGMETEVTNSINNDEQTRAQALDGSSMTLTPEIDRLAVKGELADGNADWYKFELSAGQSTSLALTNIGNTSDRGLNLELYDASGVLQSWGVGEASNVSQSIDRFVAAQAGTYYARITGIAAPYSLVVTRGASFGLELPNNLVPDISGVNVVLGMLGEYVTQSTEEQEFNGSISSENDLNGSFVPVSGAVNQYRAEVTGLISSGNNNDWDYFKVNLGPGDSLRAFLDGIGMSDAYMYLYDRNGVQLAANDDGGGNLDSLINYTNFSYRGDYYVVADSYGSSSGTYRLTLTVTTKTPGFGDSQDSYTFRAAAEDNLVIQTRTPNDAPGLLQNLLSPKLALYAPNGSLVPEADYTVTVLADGRNVRIDYTAVASGLYKIEVQAKNGTRGEYVLSVSGSTAPAVVKPVQCGLSGSAILAGETRIFSLGHFPDSLRFTFSDSLLLSSVSPASLSVNGQTASTFTIVDGQTIEFDLTGLEQSDGLYNVQLGTLYDIHGNALAAFNLSFTYDSQPPVVSAVSIAADAVLSAQALDFRATFSEALDQSYLHASNVVLINAVTGAQVAVSSFSYDAATRQLSALFPVLDEGVYQLSLLNAGFRDLAGNRLNGGSDFAVSFAVDAATRAYPTPLADKQPAGSLIFDSTASGAFHTTGDSDSFTLALVAGQTLTLELTPIDGAVQGRMEVVALDGATVLATAEAQAAGQTVLLQTLAVTQTGTYRIDASSMAGIGRYRVRTVLNAVIAVDANSTQQSAQSLESSFISLGGTATRGVARSTFDASTSDWYSFTLNAGEASTLALTDTLSASDLGLELYDSNNALLAIARNDATNVDRYIADFVPAATGTYYARISGTTATAYSLLLTRRASFGLLLQSNESQDISAAHNVLGYLADAQKVPYVFSAAAGDALVIETQTPNDGLGQVYNALSLSLALYAPDGALVPAANYTYDTPDGRNARIVYTVPVGASGLYRVDVEGLNNTEGNYVLFVTGATASAAQALQVTDTSVQNGASFRLDLFPSSLQFTFSDSVLLSSVSTAALSVNGQTPPGFTIIDGKTIAFDLTGMNQSEGSYDVHLSGLYDVHGNALAAFNLSFNYDLQPPVVSMISIAPDAVLPEQALDFHATFSEALDPAFLNAADVVLTNTQTGAQVAVSSFTYDAATRQLRVLFPVLGKPSPWS